VSTAFFVQQAETDDTTTNQESRLSKMKKKQSANCNSNNRRQWHRQFVAPGPAECRNCKIKIRSNNQLVMMRRAQATSKAGVMALASLQGSGGNVKNSCGHAVSIHSNHSRKIKYINST